MVSLIHIIMIESSGIEARPTEVDIKAIKTKTVGLVGIPVSETAAILIVGDNPVTLDAHRHLLSESGYSVVQAAGGWEGLQMIRQHRPDLVLLDIALPGPGGIEVCRRIKADSDLKNTLVVLYSGLQPAPDIQDQELETGADGYLVLPLPRRELLVRIEAVLRLNRLEESEKRLSAERQSYLDELEDLLDQRTRELVAANAALASEIAGRKRAEEESVLLESHLRQLQQLEAVATLAGGIAHDFNNILGIIVTHTEHLKQELPDGSTGREYTEGVLTACRRAKELIRQIHVLGTTDAPVQRRALYLRPVIEEATQLVRASVPSSIELQLNISNDNSMILSSESELYQVVTHLCTNAVHSMEKTGGILEVTLTDVDFNRGRIPRHLKLKPGLYVRLTVSDTGHGMDAATLKRIFDPCFTTKEPDKGSGSGLKVVYGIVNSHGGGIEVSSIPGKGTTSHVYLPRVEGKSTALGERRPPLPTDDERILFVDDEAGLVQALHKNLELFGYRVTTRTSCLEALELFRTHPDYFDLVITDYTMPHMNGLDFAKQLMEIRPGIPIILCTGWMRKLSEEMIRNAGVTVALTKPYEVADVVRVIRQALGKGPGG